MTLTCSLLFLNIWKCLKFWSDYDYFDIN